MSKSANEARVEKIFNQPAAKVFQGIAEGRLFNNCGALADRLEVDFRVGGWYRAPFNNGEIVGCGKFTEIVPDKKICFTWGDKGSGDGLPFTDVSIELFPEGNKTRVLVIHTGFSGREEVESHTYGWTTGLEDLAGEVDHSRLRIVRTYPVSREKLYRACADFGIFFAPVANLEGAEIDFKVGGQYRIKGKKGSDVRGTFKEIIPGKKIAFTWNSLGCEGALKHETLVTLSFDDEEDGASSLELVHDGLTPQEALKGHRRGWEEIVSTLKSALK